MKKVIPLLLTLLLGISSALKAETVELYWEDLIPEGYVPSDALPEIALRARICPSFLC